ncbi:MAG: DUF4149 domain-containing protein [Gemmatimonadaceae bacterium]
MIELRRTTALFVAAWLGAALLTAVVVAPAAFAVLPTRTLAGALVGRILPVLFFSGALLSLAAWVGSRKSTHRNALVRFAPGVWFVASIVAQFGVTPRIQSVRKEAGAAFETLPSDDPRRVTFGRLHGISVLLLGVGMVGALITIVDSARTQRPSEG